jgi:hypothetical protein
MGAIQPASVWSSASATASSSDIARPAVQAAANACSPGAVPTELMSACNRCPPSRSAARQWGGTMVRLEAATLRNGGPEREQEAVGEGMLDPTASNRRADAVQAAAVNDCTDTRASCRCGIVRSRTAVRGGWMEHEVPVS